MRFRQIHLDYHTSEYIKDVGRNFDGESFARTLKASYIDSITCFARCHHGWLYYPSIRHPELIHPSLVNTSMLLEQIKHCHDNDIKVPIYTTAQWDARVIREHPEWLCVDKDGGFINSQDVPEPHFYYTICLNSGYREFFKEHIMDIIEVVGASNIDGFFVDILFQVDCCCEYCISDMHKRGMDASDEVKRIEYSGIVLREFKEEITVLIQSQVPNASIFYNSSHIGPAQKKHIASYTHLELESLPSGGWGYDHFPTTVRYARRLGLPLLGMTGKFHTYWGDFHSLKNRAALEFECFLMLALGSGCSIGDQLHPNGLLSDASYELIGDVYRRIRDMEQYCVNAVPLVEIAVINPESCYDESNHSLGISPALIGTVRMLQELAYQFDIIDFSMDIDRYKLIILPDVITYSDELNELLNAYMAKGGKVIASHESLLRQDLEPNCFGIVNEGDSLYERSFVMPNDIIGKNLHKTEYVMYMRSKRVRSDIAEIIMDTIKPFFPREGKFYCSHQHAPSSGEIGEPAVLQSGNGLYISHPIFSIYRKKAPIWCKLIIKDAIDMMISDKLIEHDGPSTVITTLNRQEGLNRDLLHILHYITEKRSEDIYTIEDVIPLYNQTYSIYVGDRIIEQVISTSNNCIIEYKHIDDRVVFSVDCISGYEIICIQYQNNDESSY